MYILTYFLNILAKLTGLVKLLLIFRLYFVHLVYYIARQYLNICDGAQNSAVEAQNSNLFISPVCIEKGRRRTRRKFSSNSRFFSLIVIVLTTDFLAKLGVHNAKGLNLLKWKMYVRECVRSNEILIVYPCKACIVIMFLGKLYFYYLIL